MCAANAEKGEGFWMTVKFFRDCPTRSDQSCQHILAPCTLQSQVSFLAVSDIFSLRLASVLDAHEG